MSSPIPPNNPPIEIVDEYTIEDPELVLVVLHDKKRQILELLAQKAMNIQDLRTATEINPGTVKRHLDDLQAHHLVFVESTLENEYHIKMKYYRAVARRLHYQIPHSKCPIRF